MGSSNLLRQLESVMKKKLPTSALNIRDKHMSPPHHYRGSTVGANAEAIESSSFHFRQSSKQASRSKRMGSADINSDVFENANYDENVKSVLPSLPNMQPIKMAFGRLSDNSPSASPKSEYRREPQVPFARQKCLNKRDL